MASRAQRKAGVPAKRRGQQMGDRRSNINTQTEAEAKTPALSGRRKTANKMFADKSSTEVGSDAAGPSSTSPSVAGAIPTRKKKGHNRLR